MDTELAREKARGVGLQDVRPAPGQTVTQNPPAFTWPLPRPDSTPRFTLEIRHPDQRIERVALGHNWYLPRTAWPAGRYAWRVLRQGAAVDASDWRSFDLAADALPLFGAAPVAQSLEDADWYTRVAGRAHPRVLPAARLQALLPQLTGPRRQAWAELLARVKAQLTDPRLAPPPPPGPSDGSPDWVLATSRMAAEEQDRVDNAAVVWRVLSTPGPLADPQLASSVQADLRARVLNLARWDTTTLHGQDSDTDTPVRILLWTLALGYDQLHPVLGMADRTLVLQAITTRAQQVEQRIWGSQQRLLRLPLDSHAVTAAAALAAASAMLAGAHPEFGAERFARTVPWMYAWVHPWGGLDGGWANGGGYGEWFMDSMVPHFDSLSDAAGVDIYRTQMLQRYPLYRLYSVPPGGMLQAPFGDGAVVEGRQVPYYAYWLATRMPSQATRWMATLQPLAGNHPPAGRTVASPMVEVPAASDPGPLPGSALFESAGQVSMHSQLADPGRTSIHFRSSPYGAHNHSHADQNHFVVGSQGRALLIDSGYYDSFNSAHAQGWYRQTRAHNAVTYDGGIGQRTRQSNLPGDLSSAGRIAGFLEREDFTIATGDASAAYDAATVVRAQRSLVYVRPGLLLVHDDLLARRPVRWEWNFHALQAPQAQGGPQGVVRITRGPATACLRQIAGDRFDRLEIQSGFPVAPALVQFAPQHHGTWGRSTASAQHHSLMLVDVGCTLTEPPAVEEGPDTLTVTVGGRRFRFERGQLPSYALQRP